MKTSRNNSVRNLIIYVMLSLPFLTFISCGGTDAKSVANTPQAVDLGLSVKWAPCNIGASSPEGYGDYYSWGEVETKDEYTEENSQTYGKKFDDICGNSDYDVARAKLGGSWRMPTEEEFEELLNECTWQWTTQEGVNGYKVTGKNGNSIFLPAAGYRYGNEYAAVGVRGFYNSSTSVKMFHKNSPNLRFDSNTHQIGSSARYYGSPVRPVCD